MSASLYGGFDIGTRNSAAAFLDAKGRLKHLSFQGGGVHTSSLPFVRTALQMLDTTVKRLHDCRLVYCSLENAKTLLPTPEELYAFVDEIVAGCQFELVQNTTEHLMVDGWKYDLAGSSIEFISDHAFRAKRHVQGGKTTFELKGRAGETIWIYPCFLHTLFARFVLRKMVTAAGVYKAKDGALGSLDSHFHTLSITVPNAYNENNKEEVKDIFEAAGVPKSKVIVLNESLAGMLGYIHLNLEELRDLIEASKRPIIVCNLDCGSQTNDASLFEIGLNAKTGNFEVKVLAYQANRASGEALTEELMQEVTKAFKAARPGEHHAPDYFGWAARRLVEEFKVGVMGTPVLNINPDSQQRQVMDQSVASVSLGELHGVDIHVGTKAIWDIYERIAKDVSDPVFNMLSWFGDNERPRIDALIYTGGGTKSAVMRMLVERALHDGGRGSLINPEALSNDKLDLDLMVARGAAIFGAGKGGTKKFMHDGDDYAVLNVSAADVLPGRVLLADQGHGGQLRYTEVLKQFAPPGTQHSWLNNAQNDKSMVFCLKMDTGYAKQEDIFNAPFGVRLPDAILGRPFFGEFEYKGDGKVAFQIYPQCAHRSCQTSTTIQQFMFKDRKTGDFFCGAHKAVAARRVNRAQDFPPATLSFEAFARKPGKQGVVDLTNKFIHDYLKPYQANIADKGKEKEYGAALKDLTKKVQKDIERTDATISEIGDSVLYRLLNFAANFEVPIITQDMKSQLTLPAVETRPTRQSATFGAPSSSSGKGKKRTRKAKAALEQHEEGKGDDGPAKSPKTPRRAEMEGFDAADSKAAVVMEGFRK